MKSLPGSSYKSMFRMAVAFGILVILLTIPTALFAQASPQSHDSDPRVVPRDEQYAGLSICHQ